MVSSVRKGVNEMRILRLVGVFQVAQLPADRVFQLMSTLFGAYDELLSKLGLIKVDTIGDAYWAMAGRSQRVPP